MKKNNKKFIGFLSGLIFSSVFILMPVLAFGATNPPQPAGGQNPPTQTIDVLIKNPFTGGDDLMSLLITILDNIILPIAAVAVTLWIIWAGFQYILAQGNSDAISKANLNLLWALVGAGVLLGAKAISLVVQATINGLLK